jgi:nitroimidazol reductase NimA-like FMN-containing flavoprotein (pyridoxamine 5'-phosphate oxidase superfamily)
MPQLQQELVEFLQNQSFVVIASLDVKGRPHTACKGTVRIDPSGYLYLLDLYHGNTYENVTRNPDVSITVVDEHKFRGYCLKGKASALSNDALGAELIKSWEDKITDRLTQRLLKNIRGQKGHPRHPEILLPKPKYLIKVKIDEIIDLTPHHIK